MALAEFNKLCYAEQAKAFLNAYFLEQDVNSGVENVWKWCHLFSVLDVEKQENGNYLDEFNAHRIFESIGQATSVSDLRDSLYKKIQPVGRKTMSCIEFLLFQFGREIEDFLKRPQGDVSDRLLQLQADLAVIEELLQAAVQELKIAKEAESAALKAEQNEKQALAEVQKEENIRDETTRKLTSQSEDSTIGIVAQNRAKNLLAQHLSEDSLPLRRAKINLEASNKRATKARVRANEIAASASEKRNELLAKVDDVQKQITELQASSGSGGKGALWWIQRQLDEKRKYLPQRLQAAAASPLAT